MKSTTIHIDGIGPVLLERSKRAKHINITIRSLNKIRVGIPFGVSFKKAEDVVHSKIPWIQKHLQKLQHQKNANPFDSIVVDREKARRILTARLAQFAEQYNFQYGKVFIKNQKTRWGSCSSKNNINLNMKLILLPNELMDYVIMHELVHTRIKNHSKEFWAELNRFVGNAKQLDRKLKKYRIGLM